MFSKKKNAGIERSRLATLIAEDVRITGDLQFSEGLRMDGHIKGNVSGAAGSQTLLVLSDRGSIEGNVHCYDVVVNGRIVGDLTADHFVELQGNAHVTGNIYYQQLQMDCGASVEGKLKKCEPAQPAQPLLARPAAGSEPVRVMLRESEPREVRPAELKPSPSKAERG
ncbi:polymer-forming cytoskeletal protein [Paraburkholderia sp. Ac-20336]|uniref:bactofilin family protein n=1 Tax=Paraburkholderia sp. Ac-20336 TaxID=2703886 RepID=UPI001981F363|nr:polymer-forming cytoskeletal protein [Paraburkholderia sp. Ac-20336]MBN3806919.1 polymer-forming cytoskeletal protein [Paraburkholderia sp. Ac-20336]